MILAQITAPHFCAGLVIRGDVCIECAPILRRWAMGRTRDAIRSHCERRGWTVRAWVVA